jgi:hypothetical protein
MRLYKMPFLAIALLLVCVATSLVPAQVHDFWTGARWQDRRTITFRISSNFNTQLGLSGADTFVIQGALTWRRVSPFTFNYSPDPFNSSITTNPNPGVTTHDFRLHNPCRAPGTPPDDSKPATSCLFANDTDMFNVVTYYNTSGTYPYVINSSPPSGKYDVQQIATHEFGHWLRLQDNPPGQPSAVMTTARNRYLQEDDKTGAIQLYGPFTGWESDQAQGLRDRSTYSNQTNVVGYSGSVGTAPEFIGTTYWSADGVSVRSGLRYAQYSGYALAPNTSWWNNTIFHDETDPNFGSNNYLTIVNGMKLEWDQFNFQQRTVSIDFAMTDESKLSESNLIDTNGIRVSPAYRGTYSTGTWHHITVDLSPLQGKVIRRWMIGYNNLFSGNTGKFRTYIDNLKVTYSKPADGQAPNLLVNPDFESGTAGWNFSTNGTASWTANGVPWSGSRAADVNVANPGSNTQLFQNGITLEPNTAYRLEFSAYSNNGGDMQVDVMKHTLDYRSYGLNQWINLTSVPQRYSFDFTTTNFSSPISDARMRFWFPNVSRYNIDLVILRKITP